MPTGLTDKELNLGRGHWQSVLVGLALLLTGLFWARTFRRRTMKGMFKKVTSGVLAIFPCSRTLEYPLRVKMGAALLDGLFEHFLSLPLIIGPGPFTGYCYEIFNRPMTAGCWWICAYWSEVTTLLENAAAQSYPKPTAP
ncbi:MAG TPA: hypothetical protein DD706_24445 [Nitrospiraceae bacterium]|nr:hypothetical protein [Nitrospiraceae bacterium]